MPAGRGLILGYHGIGFVEPQDDPIALYVTAETLRIQVRSMQRRGYAFVTMREFAERFKRAGGRPAGIAALTFDDGTIDHRTVLPYTLEDLGVPGTVYVCPGLAGQPYPWADARARVRFMTEPEIVELSEHPLIEIGAHTNTHRELHKADFETALSEMSACKSTLEGLLGREVASFCYPRCHYSREASRAAPAAGYTNAVTCGVRGLWTPYELPREVMHSADGPCVRAMRMRGVYSGLGTSNSARLAREAARVADRLLGSGRR